MAIKKEFASVSTIVRQLDRFIQAVYICRHNRYYSNSFSCLTSLADLALDQEIFVEMTSLIFEELKCRTFIVTMTNTTNKVVIREEVDATRERLTLSSYFYKVYKVSRQLPLSEVQWIGSCARDEWSWYFCSFFVIIGV